MQMRLVIITFAATTFFTISAAANGWLVREEISPLDDSKNISLSRKSLEPIPNVFGLPVTPVLTVRCQENTSSIYIDWSTYLGIDNIRVTYRIDKLPAETREWKLSTNFEATGLWNGASAIPFIRSLFDHERLLVRVTPYGASPVTAVFEIDGLKAAALPLMKACHWQSQTAQTEPPLQNQAKSPEEDTFAALLKSVEQLDRRDQAEVEQSGTGQRRNEQGEARSSLGEGRLTFSEIDALRRQIGRCWTLPAGADRIEGMVVRLRIQVRPDRTMQQVSIQDDGRMGADPTFRAVAESARDAVDRCSPLELPPDKYAIWRDIVMSFYPEDAISG